MTRFPTFPPAYRERWIQQQLWLDRTLQDYFDDTVGRLPEKDAIIFPQRARSEDDTRPYLVPSRIGDDYRMTYRRWHELADALAAGLLAHGIGFEDIVSVQLPNWPEMCLLQIALARIGAVIQPMHIVYRQREMAAMLRFCESAAVIVPGAFAGFDFAAAVDELRGALPDLRVVVTCGPPGGALFPSLAQLIAEGERQRHLLQRHLEDHPVCADQVFYLNFTSGTEGAPKGFLHTHNTFISTFKRFADLQAQYDPGYAEQVVLANSPMTHSFGHLTTYQVILAGSRLVLVEKFDPRAVLGIVARERITALAGTPAHYIAMLDHPDFPTTDVSTVRSVGIGGAQCPEKLAADLERIFGVRIGNMYGMGENLLHTRTLPTDGPDIVRETVGQLVPGAELKIFSEDHAQELALGEIGEIAFRGPSLFLAYFKNPEQTAATRNAQGWFFTGDLGFVDAQGYLHLAGRKKEMINRGGTKIFPKEIEDLLVLHPQIAQAAVVGMPDYRLGERVCAYVILKVGAEAPTLAEIQAFLAGQRVMKNKFPERLEVLATFPMTPTGKVRKAELAEDVRHKLARETAAP